MVMFSANSCTDVPSLTNELLDSYNHLIDCTGTGVEHVIAVVSPSWMTVFPVMLTAVFL